MGQVDPPTVLIAGCYELGAGLEELLGPSRAPRLVRTRAVVAYVLRHDLGMKLAELATVVGRRHPSGFELLELFDREDAAGSMVAGMTMRQALERVRWRAEQLAKDPGSLPE